MEHLEIKLAVIKGQYEEYNRRRLIAPSEWNKLISLKSDLSRLEKLLAIHRYGSIVKNIYDDNMGGRE